MWKVEISSNRRSATAYIDINGLKRRDYGLYQPRIKVENSQSGLVDYVGVIPLLDLRVDYGKSIIYLLAFELLY